MYGLRSRSPFGIGKSKRRRFNQETEIDAHPSSNANQTVQVIQRLVRNLETRTPWGLRRAVEKDRKTDESNRPGYARADRETFRFFELLQDSPSPIEELVPGAEVQTSRGPAWLSLRPLTSFWEPFPQMPEPVEDRIWFDIETCGGRGQAGFLVGAVYFENNQWWLWQALARDHSEEPALLQLVTELVQKRPRLVSYSGSKNDWPFLASRWRHYQMPVPDHKDHLDLFDAAAAMYRGVLPSCRLVTLEHHLCARWREADLPSGFIPTAYVEWLEHRDGRLLAQVMLHNALDVVCLLELEPFLTAPWCPLPPRVVPVDLTSVAVG